MVKQIQNFCYILGQRVDYTTYNKASSQIIAKAKGKQNGYVCVSNVHMIMEGNDDPNFRQIVNDSTFSMYTGSKRPDILISEFEFDAEKNNEKQFIENLVAYAEAKDNCVVGDKDWHDAINQGKIKSKKLKFII